MYVPGHYEIREEDGLLVYYHTKLGKTLKITSNSCNSLKNKVKSMNLPWNTNKLPENLSSSLITPISADDEMIKVEEIDKIPEIKLSLEEQMENMLSISGSCPRGGWWVQSNYKRYD